MMSILQTLRTAFSFFSSAAPRPPAPRRTPLRLEALEDRRMLAGVQGDFNGDGFDDLVTGAALEDIGALADAGAVHVVYGTAAGLTDAAGPGNQFFNQDTADVRGNAEAGDLFGAAVAVGDFNNDGYDDVAIGAPGEGISGENNAGAVNILYGSAAGLGANNGPGNQLFHQNTAGVKGGAEAGDRFGEVLAAGDFNNDGFDDLAIGVPGEDVKAKRNAGAVNILYGSSNGLTAAGDQFWHQDKAGVKGKAQAGDAFGSALAAGDFNNDGIDDLAVGVPNEDIGGDNNAGAVNVLHGSAGRLTAAGDQFWHQDVAGVSGATQAGDHFGSALAAADFDNDGFDDLAIGVPDEDLAGVNNAGAVQVIKGSTTGLTAADNQFFSQNQASIAGTAQANDRFGAALAAGRFDNNDFVDLAIGTPGEDVDVGGTLFADAGAVNVIYSAAGGLSASAGPGNAQFTQDPAAGVLGDAAEAGDAFGTTLTVGNFDGTGLDSLAVGVPLEDVAAIVNGGAIHVIYAGDTGLNTGLAAFYFDQETGAILDAAETGDQLGGTV